jgi:hypothetical protein
MLGAGMSEQQPIESKPPVAPRTSGGGRRRGRRGGRGRSRGPRQPATAAPVEESVALTPVEAISGEPTQVESAAKQIEPPIRLREEMPVRPAPSKQRIQPPVPAEVPAAVPAVPALLSKTNKPQQPAEPNYFTGRAAKPEGSAIGRTVGEVRQIVESLEQALEQMVEVLRLVELAEHQKFADERELESLRRALHKLQPPHRERREHGG